MKRFFEDSLSNMSFTFSFIILLNAVLGYFFEYEVAGNRFILALAVIILVLTAVAYSLSHIQFASSKMYHIITFSSQLLAFYVIALWGGLIPWTLSGILSNGLVFTLLYWLNVNRKKREMERLALKINQQLSELN